MSDTLVKICGLNTQIHIQAAQDAGADYFGFILFEKSPRYIEPAKAGALIAAMDSGVSVAVMVDPDQDLLEQTGEFMKPDIIQLHGSETPEQCQTARAYAKQGVWKALGISDQSDLDQIAAYEDVVDGFVFDAKPPAGAERPGGLGEAWDYTLLRDIRTSKPWFLAGGLTVGTVADAMAQSGATAVDVVSGVESLPGVKDVQKIKDFINAARST